MRGTVKSVNGDTASVTMEGDVISAQEIFRFRQTGMTPEGQVQGKFEATGIRPRFLEHVMAHGITLSAELFRPDAKFD